MSAEREVNTAPGQAASGKHLVYLCDWLPPDFGAVGQYALLRAEALAREGHRVALYGLSSETASTENHDLEEGRLKTVRIKSTALPRDSLMKRLLWTLKTNARLLAAAFRDLRSADSIIFTGSPPFLIHFIVPLNVILRRSLVYRITDFYPECLMAALGRRSFWLGAFHRITIRLRRRVDHFEVLGEDQRLRLLEIGIDPSRISLLRDLSPVEISATEKPLDPPESLTGRVVLLYSGNLGVAHDVETFVEGYRRHHETGSGRVGFWLNAIGRHAERMAEALEAYRLPFHRSRPVALEKLATLMVSPHAHLITLRDPFVGFVLPSKVYACIQSRRPVLYIGSPGSDVHGLCVEGLPRGSYHQVGVGDAAGVADALEHIAENVPRADINPPDSKEIWPDCSDASGQRT